MAKTISQYQADIKELMKLVGEKEAQATAENRDLTANEVKVINDTMDTVDEYRQIVAAMKRRERIATDLEQPEARQTVEGPNGGKPKPEDRPQDRFAGAADFYAAVINAGLKRSVDPRLIRAGATGLGESVDSEGGFLVTKEVSTQILQDVFQTGVLAARCRRIPISANANGIKIPGADETSRASTRYGGVLGYWKAEAAQKTASHPTFRQIELNLHKLTALVYLTDELMQDAPALEAYVRQCVAGEFGFQIDDAIINGEGAGKPLGILNAGCLVSVAKESGQTANTILAENIVKMYSRMFASSLNNAVWLVNQNTLPQLFTMSLSVGTGGAPIFMPAGGLSQSPYNTILGRPVIPIEQCATLGTVGDIIFADLGGGYILAEKGGLQSDVSIHLRFDYDEQVLRFVMRLDGQPVRSSALTPYKGGAGSSLSHFVALATRA